MTIPPLGAAVTYRGSLAKLHGSAYYCGPCNCPNWDCEGYELEIIRNGYLYELDHVHRESFSSEGE